MTKNEVVLFVVISIQFLFTSHSRFPDYGAGAALRRVNGDILSTVGEIFIKLKNGNNLTTSKNAAENLLIHNFIHNVRDKYGENYEEIYNISKAPSYDEKTEYMILVISKTVRRIIKKEWHNYNKSEIIMRTVFGGVSDDSDVQGQDDRGHSVFDFVRFEREFRRGAELTSAMVAGNLLFENFKQLFAPPSSRSHVDQDVEAWEPSVTTRRLFGGRAASVAEFPFVCSVHVGGEFSCAGAILSKRAVITAASCLWRFHGAPRLPRVPITVRVGSEFTGAAGVLLPVQRMFFHKRFDLNSLSHNLVILKLQERLKFADGIRKIKFDTEATALPDTVRDLFVLGWGANNITKLEGVVYQYSTLSSSVEKVYNIESCREAYSSYYVKDTHFCTGLVDRGSGACSNDIGGPAVVGSVLVGLISFGPAHCGRRNEPTVYTKLGFYAKWITNVTNKITARKSPTKLHKQPTKNDLDLDSIKQLAGELQEVIRTKSSAAAGQVKVKARCQHSEEEKGVLKSYPLHKIARMGPEEERDPEIIDSNIKITTPRLTKSELKKQRISSANLVKRLQKTSTVMTKYFKPRVSPLATVANIKKIELEMAYDSGDTNSSSAKILLSSESEDDYSSETEEITIPLNDGKLSKEVEDNDYT